MKSTITLSIATSTLLQLASAVPSASTAICGSKGWDIDVDSFYEIHDGTYTGCAAACAKQSMCQSFAYGKNECYVYNVPVAGNFEADPGSEYTFYDASCPKPSSSSTKTTSSSTTKTTPKSTTSPSSSKSSTQPSTTPAKQTTTKSTTNLLPTTTPKTMTTITTAASKTSTAPITHETCPIDAGTCKSHPSSSITDPCSKGCGCTYTEGCGGHLVPGTTLAAFTGFTYSDCIRACDAHQPRCVGITWNQGGDCYLFSSSLGEDQNPAGQYALRQSCERPCPVVRTCGLSPYGRVVCV